MFFRPSFCANCGEKIERAEWGIFTSRRFCQVCESEFKGQDLIPRVIVGIGLVIGIIGFGGYLKNWSGASEAQLVRQPKKLMDQPTAAAPAAPKEIPATSSNGVNSTIQAVPETQNRSVPQKVVPRNLESLKAPKIQTEPAEEMYYCGAQTAKGTPCRHRVKGNVRCFQHTGMPAMLPPDQLRIR